PLDADDELGDDLELAEGLFAGLDALAPEAADDDSPGPRPALPEAWPWAVVDGAGAPDPCQAVATEGARVVAGGEALLLIDEGAHAARRAAIAARHASDASALHPGARAPVSSSARGRGPCFVRVALDGELLVVATSRGQLLLSRDFGASQKT